MTELTQREADVLRMLARGMTTAEIAFALDTRTVAIDPAAADVTAKLDATDIDQAVTKAIESGLISTEL